MSHISEGRIEDIQLRSPIAVNAGTHVHDARIASEDKLSTRLFLLKNNQTCQCLSHCLNKRTFQGGRT